MKSFSTQKMQMFKKSRALYFKKWPGYRHDKLTQFSLDGHWWSPLKVCKSILQNLCIIGRSEAHKWGSNWPPSTDIDGPPHPVANRIKEILICAEWTQHRYIVSYIVTSYWLVQSWFSNQTLIEKVCSPPIPANHKPGAHVFFNEYTELMTTLLSSVSWQDKV